MQPQKSRKWELMDNFSVLEDESSLQVFLLEVTMGKIQSLRWENSTVQIWVTCSTLGQRRLCFIVSVLPRLDEIEKGNYFLKEIGVH